MRCLPYIWTAWLQGQGNLLEQQGNASNTFLLQLPEAVSVDQSVSEQQRVGIRLMQELAWPSPTGECLPALQ